MTEEFSHPSFNPDVDYYEAYERWLNFTDVEFPDEEVSYERYYHLIRYKGIDWVSAHLNKGYTPKVSKEQQHLLGKEATDWLHKEYPFELKQLAMKIQDAGNARDFFIKTFDCNEFRIERNSHITFDFSNEQLIESLIHYQLDKF